MSKKIATDKSGAELVAQGISLIRASKLDQAVSCFENLLRRQPNNVNALYYLGFIAFQRHDASSAISYFERVIKIDPQNKNTLFSLGSLYARVGDLASAVKTYEAYIRLDNQNAAAYYYLAHNYANIDESAKAVAAFKTCIALNPGEESGYVALGQLYYRMGEFNHARDIYTLARNKGHQSSSLLTGLATVQGVLGEVDAAIETNQAALALYPKELSYLYQLSRLDKSFLDLVDTDRLLGYLKNGELGGADEAYCHFLLAKMYKKNGNLVQQLAHLERGHALYKSVEKFSTDASFYLEYLASLPCKPKQEALIKSSLADAQPIFIVGVPRCGSTLVENVLAAANTQEKIKKLEESSAIMHALAKSQVEGSHEDWARFSANADKNYSLLGIQQGAARFTDKSLENVFMIDLIIAHFSKAKIILCKRAWVASIMSILENNMLFLSWAHSIEEILQYVDSVIRAMDYFLARYPDQVYELQYEDFVSEPELQSKRLFEFCGLDWTPGCLEFYKNKSNVSRTASNKQIRNGINTHAVSKHNDYVDFFKPYAERFAWLRFE